MEAVIEIIGTIIIEGGKYLISKALDEAGNWIWRAFTDDDGDGVPDDPENPFREWDEEPENWDPFDPVPDTPVIPDTPTDTREVTIIFISADGTMTVYDESGEIKPEDCDKAYSMWVSENGIMNKKLDNYSVTEGLLALVLLFTAINFVRGLFRRKDIYR